MQSLMQRGQIYIDLNSFTVSFKILFILKEDNMIDEFGLSEATVICLKRGHIFSVGQLRLLSEGKLRKLGGMDKKNRDEVVAKMREIGAQLKEEDVTLADTMDMIGLSVRAFNCLIKANVKTVEDLLKVSEKELEQIRGCGKGTLDEINKKKQEIRTKLI